MKEQIIAKIALEVEYYYWLRKEAGRDEIAITQQLGHIQGMVDVLEMVTGEKYKLTTSGVMLDG